MYDLPADTIVHIFSFLDVKDKCKAARVCRSWYNLVRVKQLWKHVDLSSAFHLNLQSTWKVMRCYFTDALKTLHLRGFLFSVKDTECISNAVLINLCKQCPNLEEFYIEEASLINIDSGNLPASLRILQLHRCQTTPRWFKPALEQRRLAKLVELDVTKTTKVSDCDLEDLTLLSDGGDLSRLSIADCYRIGQKGFESIADNLPNLTLFDASDTSISDVDMHFICRKLKKLEILILKNCELSDLCVGSIATLSSLQTLEMTGNGMKLTGDALVGLVKALRKLERLNISTSETLTVADLEQCQGINVKCQINPPICNVPT